MNVDNFNVVVLILLILIFVFTIIIIRLNRILCGQNQYIKTLEADNMKLKAEANIDPLTNLPNRRSFEKDFNRQIRLLPLSKDEHRHVSVTGGMELLFIDIDHFKSINDDYGHPVGDKVLQTLAKTIKSVLRENDLVCRWGGEEIVVVLTNISQQDIGKVAEKIRAKIEGLKFSELSSPVTVSIGVTYAKYRCELNVLTKEADTALYQAKNSGRNKVQIYESSDLL